MDNESIHSISPVLFASASPPCSLLSGWPAHGRSFAARRPRQHAPEVHDKNVMNSSLYFAQGALEAIATENYSLLATNARS